MKWVQSESLLRRPTGWLRLSAPSGGALPVRLAARIARDADRNVRRMIAHAYQQAPFYRDTMRRLGLSPADISCVADLARLPLISVADLQRDPEAFRSPSRDDEPPVPLLTSGSTGSPHTIWHDLASIYTNAADNERQRALVQRLIGKGPRYRVLSIAALRSAHETLQQASRTGALWPKWLTLTRLVAMPPVVPRDRVALTRSSQAARLWLRIAAVFALDPRHPFIIPRRSSMPRTRCPSRCGG